MNNTEALRSLCNAIANTFYPDEAALGFVLFNQGIDAEADAAPKDPQIFRAAVSLVKGYVESSRTENGVSTSVKDDAVKYSLLYWCNYYGLDASDELGDYLRIIEDASNLW